MHERDGGSLLRESEMIMTLAETIRVGAIRAIGKLRPDIHAEDIAPRQTILNETINGGLEGLVATLRGLGPAALHGLGEAACTTLALTAAQAVIADFDGARA